MTKDIVMNTGTRTGTLWLTSTELFVVVSECRWMVLFILLVVLADFWYGRSEASKRYQIAKDNNDTVHQNEYKWRTSRAIRRTVNKLIDYLLWLCVGAVFGMALLQQWTGIIRLDPATYYVSTVPVEINIPLLIILNVATLLISLFVLIAPSYLISHIHPAKSMRYE